MQYFNFKFILFLLLSQIRWCDWEQWHCQKIGRLAKEMGCRPPKKDNQSVKSSVRYRPVLKCPVLSSLSHYLMILNEIDLNWALHSALAYPVFALLNQCCIFSSVSFCPAFLLSPSQSYLSFLFQLFYDVNQGAIRKGESWSQSCFAIRPSRHRQDDYRHPRC